MQDLLTTAATVTLYSTIGFIVFGYVAYVWHRTAPQTVSASKPIVAVAPAPVSASKPVVAAQPAPIAAPEPEVLEVPAPQPVSASKPETAPDFTAMSLDELKAIGKQYGIRGWQKWQKTTTAIARLASHPSPLLTA